MDCDERSHLVEASLQQPSPSSSSAATGPVIRATPSDGRSTDSISTYGETASSSTMAPPKEEAKTDKVTEGQDARKSFSPPDGGLWAWVVMVSAFLCNGIIFSILNSYGVLFVSLKDMYEKEGQGEAATRASIAGSLAIGFTFLLSTLSSVLSDRFGLRRTAVLGGALAFAGMLCASFSIHNITIFCITYGAMFGTGASLLYTPSLAILGHYFKRRLGIVNGVVASGSSVFTIAMPFILQGLLEPLGLANTLRFLAGLTFLLPVVAFTFIELLPKEQPAPGSEDKPWYKEVINVDNWRNPKYVIWALVVPCALFGYFVPYVHIVEHVKNVLPDANGEILITCISITSGVGRIIFGKVADSPRVNRIFLQQLSFFVIGTCTMLLTAAPFMTGVEFPAMIVFALIMGIFDGCFITMFGPIAFDICGPKGAAQGIGFILGLCSLPLTLGPPIAGQLYDRFGNYTLAFLLAGVPPIVGACLMFLIYRVRGTRSPMHQAEAEGTEQETETRERLLEEPQPQQAKKEEEKQGLKPAVTETTIVADDEDDAERKKQKDAKKEDKK